ncbi:unnamed protein product, partial [Linum tenue]
MKSSSLILIFALLMLCLIHGNEVVAATTTKCRTQLCQFANVSLDTRYRNETG